MHFTPTDINGPMLVDLDPHRDERGFFARSFCVDEFSAAGLPANVVQCSVSWSPRRGTIRGMHWQCAPSLESKLVRCTRGAVLDQIVDMRSDSPTFLKHLEVELTWENRRAIHVPPLFAHGFQTLTDEVEVLYFVDHHYSPENARGLRYNDPALGLNWPLPVSVISAKDASWPLFEEQQLLS
jgi:dTDP-4-dehydrorhamnose 3,5-epimerase